MIDRKKRREVAARIRAHLEDGTSICFSRDDLWHSSDPAVFSIFHVLWFKRTDWCDGTVETLSPETLRRAEEFLESDLPYQWPSPGLGWRWRLRRLVRKIVHGRLHSPDFDPSVWPFARPADYEQFCGARRKPGNDPNG